MTPTEAAVKTTCASNPKMHPTPVPAEVPGTFVNPWNPDKNARTAYCKRCADHLAACGLFVPDAGQ